jgi:hypothetical protein
MTRLEILKQHIHEYAWNKLDDVPLDNLDSLTVEDLDEAIKCMADYAGDIAWGRYCPHLNHKFLKRASEVLIKLNELKEKIE